MPQTKTPRRAPAAKAPASRKRPAAAKEHKAAVTKTTELSEEVLQRLEAGQRAAIEAVTEFLDTVDRALPALPHGEGASKRQTVVDAAMKMADRLVHTQYDFLRKIVHDAGESLSRSEADKK